MCSRKKVGMMKPICIGDQFQIHCYKHDGKIHCAWEEAIVLDIKKDYIVFGNDHTLVTEADGRTWRTKEPAVIYFFRNKWFNVIAQLKKDGISYYCNVESPYIIEEGVIKYIDYDLDVRIYPSGDYRILDRMEYKYHKQLMQYSDQLDIAIHNGLDELIHLYKDGSKVFQAEQNIQYHEIYEKLKSENK